MIAIKIFLKNIKHNTRSSWRRLDSKFLIHYWLGFQSWFERSESSRDLYFEFETERTLYCWLQIYTAPFTHQHNIQCTLILTIKSLILVWGSKCPLSTSINSNLHPFHSPCFLCFASLVTIIKPQFTPSLSTFNVIINPF